MKNYILILLLIALCLCGCANKSDIENQLYEKELATKTDIYLKTVESDYQSLMIMFTILKKSGVDTDNIFNATTEQYNICKSVFEESKNFEKESAKEMITLVDTSYQTWGEIVDGVYQVMNESL